MPVFFISIDDHSFLGIFYFHCQCISPDDEISIGNSHPFYLSWLAVGLFFDAQCDVFLGKPSRPSIFNQKSIQTCASIHVREFS
jgi:hypothetical protein